MDVSAMAMDFSVLARPLLVFCPPALADSLNASPLWNIARKIDSTWGVNITVQITQALDGDLLPNSIAFVKDHFGDTAPGSSKHLLEEAIHKVTHGLR